MRNSTIVRVILLGSIAILSIIASQAYWIGRTWNLKEQEFHEKVNIALREVTAEYGKLGTLPPYNLIDQVANNYYVVNVNQAINVHDLELFLRKHLEAVGLEENFQYAVYDCTSNTMVGCALINYNADAETAKIAEQIELPVHDKYTYYFGIRFPDRNSQILSSMMPMMIPAGILLVTIIFFTYSIFVILRQKRLSEMQKDFINNMTHEFKTPISTIKISADVFLNDPNVQTNERLSRYASIIKEQNQRLNSQVEKVLQLAKIEENHFKLKMESLDLHSTIEECLKGVKIKIETLGGVLSTELIANQPVIKADHLHLTNVLHNILDNAVKYCKEQPHITIRTVQGKNQLFLIVADQGIGIAKEHQEQVFQKFYRVPTGNIHNVKGFGLGLFYIKNVCKAHGWKLSLKSELNKGTCIEIGIPLSNNYP